MHELFSLLNTFSALLNSCRLYNVLNSSQVLFYSGSVLVLMERVYDHLILPRVKLCLYFFFFFFAKLVLFRRCLQHDTRKIIKLYWITEEDTAQ